MSRPIQQILRLFIPVIFPLEFRLFKYHKYIHIFLEEKSNRNNVGSVKVKLFYQSNYFESFRFSSWVCGNFVNCYRRSKKKKKTLEYAGVKYMGNKSVISFYVWKLYGKVSQESRV